MSLEIGCAIKILTFWNKFKGKKGPITIDIGVNAHKSGRYRFDPDDIISLGFVGKEITLSEFTKFLTEVKIKADNMEEKYGGTYWYSGIRKPDRYKKYETNVDYQIIWST